MCGARYTTANGVLVQFTYQGNESFARAEIPPAHLQMVKYAAVQRAHSGAVAPESLLTAIPEVALVSTNVIKPHPTLRGTYTFARDLFERIPLVNWHNWMSPELLFT